MVVGAWALTSIERTAYPRFKRLISTRELAEFYTPSVDEAVWARGRTRNQPHHLLALLVMLKSCARLGWFPSLETVPAVVVEHVRECAGIPVGTVAGLDSTRTAKRYREAVRSRLGLAFDPEKGRLLAAEAMERAAVVKSHGADLVNVALEEIVRAGLELPGFSTLDRMAGTIRTRTDHGLHAMIVAAMSGEARARSALLLTVAAGERTSGFDALKTPAHKATWSRFRELAERVEWLDGLGDTVAWTAGVAPAKAAAFAAQARVLSVGEMLDIVEPKRTAMVACLAAEARARGKDDLVVMLCKRVARHQKRAQEELEELQARHKSLTEQLIRSYRDVLDVLRSSPDGGGGAGTLDDAFTPAEARAVVERAGGFDARLADIEAVAAHAGGNHTPLVERFFRVDRPTMLKLATKLTFTATSADRAVLKALDHAVAHWNLTRDHISDIPLTAQDAGTAGEVERLDLSFASKNWLRTVYAKDRPGMLVRRHFEAMVFCHLVEELRCGDIAVVGGQEYGDWTKMLLPWEDCERLLDEFCAEAGLPADAQAFTEQVKARLTEAAERVDAGYPDNADLVIDPFTGVPSLKQRQGIDRTASAIALEAEVSRRLPERSILEALARSAHWSGWWRRLGPLSGSDPELKHPLPRYVLTAFTYGCNLGPAQAARHLRGTVTAHELAAIAQRHTTAANLGRAGADIVDNFMDLDITTAWGDGSAVAVDGTMMDTAIDNLLAETSIRYGGYGGIAYHLVSDTYIALFSRFIPCGVWEAVYLIDSLLANTSQVKPDRVHADTQGQSFPVFGLAHVLGIDLLPRIRNRQDLTFHRPDARTKYTHIDALFSTDPRTAVDWGLIERHFRDLMQVAISVKEGTVSSVTLLRRLGNHSRKNSIYRAYRELGRAVRTITLLRYLSDPALRDQIAKATNKAEAYNGFTKWLAFGNHGILGSRDPEHQEKAVKFLDPVAGSVIFSTAVDMTQALRDMARAGRTVDPADLAVLSPYRRETIRRFGDYNTDGLHIPPAPVDPHLDITRRSHQSRQAR